MSSLIVIACVRDVEGLDKESHCILVEKTACMINDRSLNSHMERWKGEIRSPPFQRDSRPMDACVVHSWLSISAVFRVFLC